MATLRRRPRLAGRTWITLLAWMAALLSLVAFLRPYRESLAGANIVLLLLLLVLVANVASGWMAGALVAVGGLVAIDVVFQQPYGVLGPSAPTDALALAAFLGTAFVTTAAIARAEQRAEEARRRSDEVASLARLGAATLGASTADGAIAAVEQLAERLLQVEWCRLVPAEPRRPDLQRSRADATASPPDVFRDAPAMLPNRLVHPVALDDGTTVGVLAIAASHPVIPDDDSRRFLDAVGFYAALAVERGRLSRHQEEARVLREAGRVRDLFVAGLSHDLRTPLTTIRAGAERMVRDGVAGAGDVEAAAARLQAMVMGLLELAQLRAGALPLAPEVNAVEDLVGAALRAVEPHRAGRTITVGPGLRDAELYGRFDFVQTLRILTNLLENAIRHAAEGGHVLLDARWDARELQLTVSDDGSGIPADEAALVFQPFVRGTRGVDRGGGTGLGLAIARSLAEAQGGRVWYQARVPHGSHFHLALPAAEPASRADDNSVVTRSPADALEA